MTVEAHPAPEAWEQFRQVLRSRVTPITWQTWLEGLRPQPAAEDDAGDGSVIHIEAPSEFHLRWVSDKYRDLVEEAAQAAFGSDTTIELDAPAEPAFVPTQDADEDVEPEVTPSRSSEAPPKAVPEGSDLVSQLLEKRFRRSGVAQEIEDFLG